MARFYAFTGPEELREKMTQDKLGHFQTSPQPPPEKWSDD